MSEECGCGGITPLVWKDQVPDEVFVVVQNRTDGTQPKVCKTLGMRWFSTIEDAKEFWKSKSNAEIERYFSIYRAHVTVLDRIEGE